MQHVLEKIHLEQISFKKNLHVFLQTAHLKLVKTASILLFSLSFYKLKMTFPSVLFRRIITLKNEFGTFNHSTISLIFNFEWHFPYGKLFSSKYFLKKFLLILLVGGMILDQCLCFWYGNTSESPLGKQVTGGTRHTMKGLPMPRTHTPTNGKDSSMRGYRMAL